MVQALSNPSVRINNDTIYIVPNTFSPTLGGGEINVRAASAGGNSVEPVHTSNAETKISTWTFDIYSTPENIKSVRAWQDSIGTNVVSGIETLADGSSVSLSLTTASLVNDPELGLSADGVISLEFKGAQTIVS